MDASLSSTRSVGMFRIEASPPMVTVWVADMRVITPLAMQSPPSHAPAEANSTTRGGPVRAVRRWRSRGLELGRVDLAAALEQSAVLKAKAEESPMYAPSFLTVGVRSRAIVTRSQS